MARNSRDLKTHVPGPFSAKHLMLSSTDNDNVLNESTETLASNISLNESCDCSLELNDVDNTADQNENSDDADTEEDSDTEIYLPPGPGFASPDDVVFDNCVYYERKYLNQHTWAYYSHNKGGYFCKMCKIVYGDRPCSNNRSRGAWSHNGIIFKRQSWEKI